MYRKWKQVAQYDMKSWMKNQKLDEKPKLKNIR